MTTFFRVHDPQTTRHAHSKTLKSIFSTLGLNPAPYYALAAVGAPVPSGPRHNWRGATGRVGTPVQRRDAHPCQCSSSHAYAGPTVPRPQSVRRTAAHNPICDALFGRIQPQMVEIVAAVLDEAILQFYGSEHRGMIIGYARDAIPALARDGAPDLSRLVPRLHELFAAFPEHRVSVLKVFLNVELFGSGLKDDARSHFLLAWFLNDLRSPNKDVRFVLRYLTQISDRGRRPHPAALRALVSVLSLVNPRVHRQVIRFFCESLDHCDDYLCVMEIHTILVDHMIEAESHVVLDLVQRAAYRRSTAITGNMSLGRFLAGFVNVDPKVRKVQGVPKMLMRLLMTWNGMLEFGVRDGMLRILTHSLSHNPKRAATAIRDVMCLPVLADAVTLAFSGFVMSVLITYNLFERVCRAVRHDRSPSIMCLMCDLAPYITKGMAFKHTHLEGPVGHASDTRVSGAKSMVHARFMFDLKPLEVVTIDGVAAMLKGQVWKWESIIELFEFTVRVSGLERQCGKGKERFKRCIKSIVETVLTFFAGSWSPETRYVSEALNALIRYLVDLSEWGHEWLSSHEPFVRALIDACDWLDECKFDPDDMNWKRFICITMILNIQEGSELLSRMECGETTVKNRLVQLGRNCRSPDVCAKMLDMVSFDGCMRNARECVGQPLLDCTDTDVHRQCITEFSKKVRGMDRAVTMGFLDMIMANVNTVGAQGAPDDNLKMSLHFLGELIYMEPYHIEVVLRNPGCLAIVNMMRVHCRYMICFAASRTEGMKMPWVREEVEWWVNDGMREYVYVYDKAFEASFGDDDVAAVNAKRETVLKFEGAVVTPPHMFGQLTQTELGMVAARECMNTLLGKMAAGMRDDTDARAALLAIGHFASTQDADDYMEANSVPEMMMALMAQHGSNEVRGSLLTAFSMCHRSPYLNGCTEAMGLCRFQFGPHEVNVPMDPMAWLGILELKSFKEVELPGFGPNVSVAKSVRDLVIMPNGEARFDRKLQRYGSAFKDPDTALYMHSLMGSISVGRELRSVAYKPFDATPLMRCLDRGADNAVTSRASAKLYVLLSSDRAIQGEVASVAVPIMSVCGLRALAWPPRCPEAFISEADLVDAVGCSFAEFFAKSRAEQVDLRSRLLG